METQSFLSRLVSTFESECNTILQFDQSEYNHQNKLVQTIRVSNKVEITNIITKYKIQDYHRFKRLFNDLFTQTIKFIEKECNLFLNERIGSIPKYIFQIDKQKRILIEKEQQITDLLLENIEFQAQLNKKNLNYEIETQQNILINSLYQKIEELEKSINELQKKISLQYLTNQELENQLQQKTKSESQIVINTQQQTLIKKKTLDLYYDEFESIKSNIQELQNQDIEQQQQKQNKSIQQIQESFDVGETIMSVCKNKKDSKTSNLVNLSSIIRRVEITGQGNKLPTVANKTIYVDIKKKIQQNNNRPKKMDDLYLFSRSQRSSSTTVNADHYFEIPQMYRYDVFNKTRKFS